MNTEPKSTFSFSISEFSFYLFLSWEQHCISVIEKNRHPKNCDIKCCETNSMFSPKFVFIKAKTGNRKNTPTKLQIYRLLQNEKEEIFFRIKNRNIYQRKFYHWNVKYY